MAGGKRSKKASAPASAKDIVPSAEDIEKFGFVRALIRARNAAGFVSPNRGKPRLSKKEQAAAANA